MRMKTDKRVALFCATQNNAAPLVACWTVAHTLIITPSTAAFPSQVHTLDPTISSSYYSAPGQYLQRRRMYQ
ncbi:hypothetical protein PLICRDRAFT_37650 [Plicaturopsis crispa FD-325 SS-3]|nr:hypothetical protein PLICRDRAFT_37650 [Plicaturopsis crispa FD-325 SS-3]